MASFLEQFNSTIRKKQTEQILKLLNKQRSTGAIRTVEEFTTKLENLIRDLTSENIKPTLSLFPAESSEEISSETFNFMLDRVEDDLVTAFSEAYNIDQVQKAHQAIVRDVLLKNLKHGISELESKVDLYEFLEGDKNGFTSSIFSTFREAREERTSRAGGFKQEAALFTDPRSNLPTVPNAEDAVIDLVGERLTLGSDNKNLFNPRQVIQIFDDETITSTEGVTRPGASLKNMVDGKNNTFWVQEVLVKESRPNLITKLLFDLPGTKTINSLEIEPANVFPFYLKTIYYYDSNNVLQTLVSPNLLIQTTTSYIFPTVTTSKVMLEFESITRRSISFEKTSDQNLIWQAVGQANPTIKGLVGGFRSIQIPKSILDITGLPQKIVEQVRGEIFEIGFDNVRFGKTSYSPKSIYISKALEVNDPLQVGLKVIEKRPSSINLSDVPEMTETTYDVGNDNTIFHGSIEYYVIKRDFDKANNIVATYKLPILPTGVTRIHHERLVLSERSSASVFLNDVGYLQFFADIENSDLIFYRNGVPMVLSSWEDQSTTDMLTPNRGTRMRTKIKINNMAVGDIITVSYNPVVSSTVSLPETFSEYSSTGISVVDLTGNVSARSVNDHLLILNKGPDPERVVRSQLYLAIILRNNSSDTALTPAVEEYTLVVGEKDIQKFAEAAF